MTSRPTALEILAANLRRLMQEHPDLDSQPKVKGKGKVGQRTVGRALKQEVSPRLSSVQKFADAFSLEPWQLFVPGLDPQRLPGLTTHQQDFRDSRDQTLD